MRAISQATQVRIAELVEQYSKENLIFTLLMRRLNGFMGITNSALLDPYEMVDAVIDETHFKVSDRYKVTMRAVDFEHFGDTTISMREVEENIRFGHIKWRVKE
jgi:hypothetical protein